MTRPRKRSTANGEIKLRPAGREVNTLTAWPTRLCDTMVLFEMRMRLTTREDGPFRVKFVTKRPSSRVVNLIFISNSTIVSTQPRVCR